jgi:hypothetical protein
MKTKETILSLGKLNQNNHFFILNYATFAITSNNDTKQQNAKA